MVLIFGVEISFFSFKDNQVKLHHKLELPKKQILGEVIKMGDIYHGDQYSHLLGAHGQNMFTK